jgi:hypothetical protein
LVRAVTSSNPEHFDRVLGWHLRDALLAYEDHLRRAQAEDYRQRRLEFAMLAPWIPKEQRKAPQPPPLLR